MFRHIFHLVIAALLAAAALLSGCAEVPAGFVAAFGFTLDPIGVQFSLTQPPLISAVPGAGWSLPSGSCATGSGSCATGSTTAPTTTTTTTPSSTELLTPPPVVP